MKIFVSYRRSDAQHFAGRLADRLSHTRGISQVFLDVDSIAAGEDFEKRIRIAMDQCAVALVVIGPDWLKGNRLADPADFVRLEVREALKSHSRVIPILADGTMPLPSELPDELQPLIRLNALSVRHTAFDRDMAHLLDAIFERKPPGAMGAFFRAHPVLTAILESLGGALAAFVLLMLALVVINDNGNGPSLNQLVGGDGMAILVMLLVAAFGAATPWLLRRAGLLR